MRSNMGPLSDMEDKTIALRSGPKVVTTGISPRDLSSISILFTQHTMSRFQFIIVGTAKEKETLWMFQFFD